MSEFKVEVGYVTNVRKHPNADSLSMAEIHGYPVIFKTGDYQEGQLATHIPVDSIVPNTPEWAFLEGRLRIKAKRLRGVFSMGMLHKAEADWQVGQNVQEELGITKYEVPEDLVMQSESEPDPGFLPVYTDIEGWRRWRDVIAPGEEVVLTEKLHGCNSRYIFNEGRLWVGSRAQIKKQDEKNLWWSIAIKLDLEKRLAEMPGIAIYGEAYGQVQDLKYGKPSGVELRLFDALDIQTRRYLDHENFLDVARKLDLPVVPELHRGPWGIDLLPLAEGESTIPNAKHVREGFVVKPVQERFDERIGRVILKVVGEGYLTRKGA